MSRRWLVVEILLVLIVALSFAAWRFAGRARAPAPAAPVTDTHAPPPAADPAPALGVPPPPPGPEATPELPSGLGAVDLAEVQRALPDNLYWSTAAPTTDPRVLEERDREKAFQNEQYGKILSGTGTDEEILDYYDHRLRVSKDYVAFTDYLLEHYGSDLTDQDQTLLHLARKLQLARQEEIPRRIQEARERKEKQDEAVRQWREEQRAFESDSESPR